VLVGGNCKKCNAYEQCVIPLAIGPARFASCFFKLEPAHCALAGVAPLLKSAVLPSLAMVLHALICGIGSRVIASVSQALEGVRRCSIDRRSF